MSVLEAVCEYVASPSDTTVLVLAGEKFPTSKKGQKNWGTRIRNAVKKSGLALTFANRDVSPIGFVQQQVREHGKEISRRDAEILVELVGVDLGRLQLEVDKLVLFVGVETVIGSAAIHQACSLLAEAVIWDLTTALANRNANRAIASLHRLLESGDAPHRLLAMMVWQYRTILQAVEMLASGAPDDQVRRATKMRWDTLKVVKAMVREGGGRSSAEALAELAHANREMNRHRAGGRRILEELVVRLCV